MGDQDPRVDEVPGPRTDGHLFQNARRPAQSLPGLWPDLSIEPSDQPGMLRVRDAGISSGSLRKTLEMSRSSNLSAAGYTQKRWTV